MPSIIGKIRYVSNKPELTAAAQARGLAIYERGREHFRLTRNMDGQTTLSCYCEIDEPAPTVQREVIYTMDAYGRPQECFVRIALNQRWIGSGWYRFNEHEIVLECDSAASGRTTQRVAIAETYDGFGTHPISADAYMTRLIDCKLGPRRKKLVCYLPSSDHRGAEAPTIARVEITLEYLGEESIDVPAGRFDCRHFRFVDDREIEGMGGKRHPDYDLWVTHDHAFVAGRIDGYMQARYELVSLDQGDV
jgi:hypothetical protein